MEKKMSTLEKFLIDNSLLKRFKSVMALSVINPGEKSPNFELFFERHGEDPEGLECAIDFKLYPQWREVNAEFQMYFNKKLN
jgi:hypothetical protein